MDGWKFKRQVPFGNFIIDFFCYDARLAIEVDGATHSAAKEISQDAERTAFLESNGVRLVRFSNTDIFENLDGALEMIYLELGQQPAPSPGALRAGADAPGRRPLPKGRGDAQAAKREST